MTSNGSTEDGRQIGNYTIIAELASGGFGSVFQAKHAIFTERPIVAIKLMHTHLGSQSQHQQFIQEARLLERLRHPYILPIIDAGIYEGFPYLVTDYAPNGSLRGYLRRFSGRPVPIADALTIISQVGEALQFAHDQGVIHRDLKPENVLFDIHEYALLADFGIAMVLESGSVKSANSSGTPAYMAPEQFRGTISKQSDQYALGCIAYEVLTGRKPFLDRDPLVLMVKHATEVPEPPTQFNAQLPLYVEMAILKALSKSRTDRFEDVAAFISALHTPTLMTRSRPQPGTVPPPMITRPLSPAERRSRMLSDPAAASRSHTTLPFEPPSSPFAGLPNQEELTTDEPAPGPGIIELSSPSARSRPNPTIPSRPQQSTYRTPTNPSRPPMQRSSDDDPDEISTGQGILYTPDSKPSNTRPPTSRPPVHASRPSNPTPTRSYPGNSEPVYRAPFPWYRVRPLALTAGTIILLALLVVTSLAYLAPATLGSYARYFPGAPLPATVTLTPTSTVLTHTFPLTALTTGTPDPAQNQVPSRFITSPAQSQQKTVNATGKGQTPGVQATGTLTFFNGSGLNRTIPAGTIITDSHGVQIISDRDANIPAANPPNDGQVAVPAHVIKPGAGGNIGALDLKGQVCCGTLYYAVQNPAAFTGGQDPQTFTEVQQSDINAAANQLKPQLTQSARSAFATLIHANEQAVADPQCPAGITANHAAGDKAATVTVSVSVVCTGAAYDRATAQDLGARLLQQQANISPGTNYALMGSVVTTVAPATPPTANQTSISLLATAQGTWTYRFSPDQQEAMRRLIVGKTPAEARALLAALPGVKSSNIQLSTGRQTLPTSTAQIVIVIGDTTTHG